MFDRDQLIARMKRDVARRGSQRALAAAIGVNEAFLSHVLAGRYPPNDAVLDFYGLSERVVYVRNISRDEVTA